MRSALLIGALAALVAASPVAKPQEIEFDQYDAAIAPTVTTPPVDDGTSDAPDYDSSSAAAAAASDPVTSGNSPSKRGSACAKQPSGSGPQTSPDDATDFLANAIYNETAVAAATPDGYSLSFGPVQGATSADSYMGYYTLSSYNPIQCQEYCDAADSCYAFNIYMERDPTVDPADSCPNPPSTTNIKCSLWGSKIDNKTATNSGQWRNAFQVVIAGSMGFNKLAAPPANPGFNGPTEFGGAINAPSAYMGAKYYAGPYNPAQCASSCQATTAYNKAHPHSDGTYNTCAFFNSYVLSKNGAPQGTYCSMYTQAWTKQYATNYGQYRGSDYYSVSQSYGWTLASSS